MRRAHLFLFRGFVVQEHCVVAILLSSFAEEVNETFSSVCSAFSEKGDGFCEFSKAGSNPSIIRRYCDVPRPFSSFELLEKLLVFLTRTFCRRCLLVLVIFLKILKVHFQPTSPALSRFILRLAWPPCLEWDECERTESTARVWVGMIYEALDNYVA